MSREVLLPRKGDWIRFYLNGRLVIGQIEYVWKEITGAPIYQTDAGSTRTYEEIRR
jgi:hypothetical protein